MARPRVEKPQRKAKVEIVKHHRIDVVTFLEIGQKIAVQAIRLEDEEYITMHSAILRYRMSGRRASVRKIAPRDHDQQMKFLIQTSLNKLAKDNFSDTLDRLTTNNDDFLTDKFFDFLIDGLFDQVREQMLYAPLYALLVFQIGCHVLNSPDMQPHKHRFLTAVVAKSATFLNGRADSLTPALATFIGALVGRDVIPVRPVYDAALRLLRSDSPAHLELCGRLVYLCGRQIDAVSGSEASLFARWRALSQDRSVPGHVRFFLQDLLEARAQHWEADFKLLDVRDVIRQRPRPPSRPSSPHPVIAAGENRFAGLMDDDDEAEAEADGEPEPELECDASEVAEGVLRCFLSERTVADDWRPQCTGELLLQVALLPAPRVGAGVRLLCELDERGLFDAAAARDAMPGVVTDVREHGGALAPCGLIFATLVRLRCVTPDMFGDVFAEYHFEVVVAFLSEISALKLARRVGESAFWMRYAWRPPEADHVALARAFAEIASEDERADVSLLFPLYAGIADLDAMVAHPEEEEKSVAEWAAGLAEDVREAEEFVGAALQIAVDAGERAVAQVAPIVSKKREVVLRWFERFAAARNLADQERANLLRLIEQFAHFE
jgi:hypothetical protein